MNRDRVTNAFALRIGRLSIARHPALMFNPWIEGYRDYAFGGRAGPAIHVQNVFHELGHAAQFGPDQFRSRASAEGFKFKVPSKFIYDRYCDVPVSSNATKRELATFAFQLRLMEAAGLKVRPEAFAEYSGHVMRLMHDWYNVPGDEEEHRKAWCAAGILEKYEALSEHEALENLEGWLDRTAARLKRDRMKTRAYHRVDVRWRPLLPAISDAAQL